MKNIRTALGVFAVTVLMAAASMTAVLAQAPDASADRDPVTPATKNAARFCDRFPDMTYDLMTQCIRVALTPERATDTTAFPDGRVMVRECISEAHAEDSGHTRTVRERHDFIEECLHWAGM